MKKLNYVAVLVVAFLFVSVVSNATGIGSRLEFKAFDIEEVDNLYMGKTVKAIWTVSYSPKHVMILQEMVHDARIIRIDSEHGPQSNRTWLGDSIAYWDGDVLVVETKNFRKVNGLAGADENLHVTERFSRRDDGNLLYDFTVNDPTVWEAEWSGKYEWQSKPHSKVYEYACHEGNYAMGNILRGARLLESEWQANADTNDASSDGAD